MGLRDTLNQNSAVVMVIAVLGIVVCAVLIGRGLSRGSSAGVGEVHYYDLNTDKIFIGVAQRQEPVEAPSGPTAEGKPAGVRAHIVSCGKCRSNYDGMTAQQIEEAGAYLAYLIINPPMPTVDSSGANTADPRMLILSDPMVRAVDGGPWMSAGSAKAMALLTQARDRCEAGANLLACHP